MTLYSYSTSLCPVRNDGKFLGFPSGLSKVSGRHSGVLNGSFKSHRIFIKFHGSHSLFFSSYVRLSVSVFSQSYLTFSISCKAKKVLKYQFVCLFSRLFFINECLNIILQLECLELSFKIL